MHIVIKVDIAFRTNIENVRAVTPGDKIKRVGGQIHEISEVGELRKIEVGARAGKQFRVVTFRTGPNSQSATTLSEN